MKLKKKYRLYIILHNFIYIYIYKIRYYRVQRNATITITKESNGKQARILKQKKILMRDKNIKKKNIYTQTFKIKMERERERERERIFVPLFLSSFHFLFHFI